MATAEATFELPSGARVVVVKRAAEVLAKTSVEPDCPYYAFAVKNVRGKNPRTVVLRSAYGKTEEEARLFLEVAPYNPPKVRRRGKAVEV